MGERVLVHHFYAHNVGHAVEALHYAHGHWRADPSREVSVLLPARAPTELAALCPWVHEVFAVDHPFLEPGGSPDALAGVPREWDVIVDDPRRYQPHQLEAFPGMRALYERSDAWFEPGLRTIEGAGRCAYAQAPWRFALPERLRGIGEGRFRDRGPRFAILPAGSGGSGGPAGPSAAAWGTVIDALVAASGPATEVAILGRRPAGDRTATTMAAGDLDALLAHPVEPVDAVDLPLEQQLAVVHAADVFVSPHTGFGLAALAVGRPWLTLSGGPWFEYFHNGVPFRSILPAPEHRAAPFTDERVAADLPRIVSAADELAAGTLAYETALRDHYAALVVAVGRDAIWSIDGVHAAYV